MNKRKVILRADGGPIIGMGHFTRTLALAEMLSQQFRCIFATRTPSEYQSQEIEKVCHGRIDLPEDNSHFDLFINYLKGDEIVVLDNYYFTTEYQWKIKAKGCKLVCIDDMHNRHYLADVVINHAEGMELSDFSVENYTKLLLGFKYALIRKAFRQALSKDILKEHSGLVIMGGADPKGITSKIVKSLADMNLDKPVAVVYGKVQKEETVTNNPGKFNLYQKLDAAEIAHLMRSSQFGILPASTVAIEACAIRMPFVCGYFVDNHRRIYNGIKSKNLALCLDDYNQLTHKKFMHSISQIKKPVHFDAICNRQKDLMDNKMENRFLEVFKIL